MADISDPGNDERDCGDPDSRNSDPMHSADPHPLKRRPGSLNNRWSPRDPRPLLPQIADHSPPRRW
jgi:hypothetical protein